MNNFRLWICLMLSLFYVSNLCGQIYKYFDYEIGVSIITDLISYDEGLFFIMTNESYGEPLIIHADRNLEEVDGSYLDDLHFELYQIHGIEWVGEDILTLVTGISEGEHLMYSLILDRNLNLKKMVDSVEITESKLTPGPLQYFDKLEKYIFFGRSLYIPNEPDPMLIITMSKNGKIEEKIINDSIWTFSE